MGKRKAGTVTLKIGGPQDYEQVADRVAEHTKETVLKALQTATKPQDLVDAEKEYQETRERSHEEALKLAKKQKTDWKPHASAFTLICAAGTDSLAFNIQEENDSNNPPCLLCLRGIEIITSSTPDRPSGAECTVTACPRCDGTGRVSDAALAKRKEDRLKTKRRILEIRRLICDVALGAGPHDFYIPSPFGEQFFEFMQAACECLEIDYEEIDTEDETCKALVDEKYTFTSAWNQQDVRAKMDEFGTILEDHGYDLKIYDEEDQTMKLTMSKR